MVCDAISAVTQGPVRALADAGVTPAAHDLIGALDQIPLLINEVADGARDFIPLPGQVQRSSAIGRRMTVSSTEYARVAISRRQIG